MGAGMAADVERQGCVGPMVESQGEGWWRWGELGEVEEREDMKGGPSGHCPLWTGVEVWVWATGSETEDWPRWKGPAHTGRGWGTCQWPRV